MTLQEAQARRVCRICGGSCQGGMVYAYGAEHAHGECLERERRRQRNVTIVCIALMAAATLAAAWFLSQGA